ncbi:hypothetical protein BCR42DRAFT_425870 [Absidia repens]|uniref:B30.2/SPRY domain-containing protein n=1 Tax=Absidia repens TaxID=90262 RepID=A0A1X2I285_9FUNG|nr:hypothetical protein BCR42DRAFT_425870 [Absidia repens]
MTIFTRQKAMYPKDKGGSYFFDKNTTVMIEHSWKHVLAIARNQMEELDLPPSNSNNDLRQTPSATSFYHHPSSSYSSGSSTVDTGARAQHRILSEQLGQRQSQQQQQHNGLYDRERLMIQALDTLFSVACEGSGYIIFLATMVQLLDPDCPVSMAFLSHVIDRATLPSKSTMACVSSALLSKLGFKYSHHTHAALSTTMYGDSTKNNNGRWNAWMAQTCTAWTNQQHKQQSPMCEFGSQVDGRMKRNFLVILAILAEKFAGEMVHLLWTPDISVILFYFLASSDETWTVRVFALLVLEKFALTGDIKSSILQHPLHIQDALKQAIGDSKFGGLDGTEHNDAVITTTSTHAATTTRYKDEDDPTVRTGISAFLNTLGKCHERPCVDWISTCIQKLSKRKPATQHSSNSMEQECTTIHRDSNNDNSYLHQQQSSSSSSSTEFMDIDKLDREDSYDMYSDDDDDDDDDVDNCDDGCFNNCDDASDNISRYGLTEQEDQEDAIKDRGYSFDSSWTAENTCNLDYNNEGNRKSSSLMRLENSPRASVMKRMELALCAEWSLGHIFNNNLDKCGPSTWDLSGLNVIVNPFDATQHWKIGTNGLELRNDRLYFESIRATACVKKVDVTEGIMQIGWCTNRCRFVPEDGYGVGDDQHGFAFDTYRSAVWANGSAVYPQQRSPQYKCRAGDVLGSFLDMDQGICSFYVNGKDLGSTVAFEHASSSSSNKDDDHNGMEGLFPAFSLTTHQHILVNFGDRPWMYLPDKLIVASSSTAGTMNSRNEEWKGINQADSMTATFRQQLKNGKSHSHAATLDDLNDDDATMVTTDTTTTTLCSSQSQSSLALSKNNAHDNNDLMNDDDWDGPLCTMCFNEPKDTNLIPCGHGSWGATCTKILESW